MTAGPIISSSFIVSIKLSSISVLAGSPCALGVGRGILRHVRLIKLLLTVFTHTICYVVFRSAGCQKPAAPSITLAPVKDF